MPKKDSRVDSYIQNAAAFAQPILRHLRQLVHTACPEAVETMKWTFPHFDYKGMLCSMAAFKAHCAFGFWKSDLVLGKPGQESAMGQFGRITSLKDLPADAVLQRYVRKAVALNDAGIKNPRQARARNPVKLVVPADLRAALKQNQKARQTFEDFSPSHRKEYVEWITEAKREDTRARRLQTTLDWLAKGKPRNWKYQ